MTTVPATHDRWATTRRAMPADFPRLARIKTNKDLCAHYSAGQNTVYRWRRQSGVMHRAESIPANTQMPADFAERAVGMTISDAMVAFNRPESTIRRWFNYVKLTPVQPAPVPPVRISRPNKAVIRSELNQSPQSLAAQHLRRHYASVHRADIRLRDGSSKTWGDEQGLENHGHGQYFVSGLGVMPDLEMIGLARDLGFQDHAAC